MKRIFDKIIIITLLCTTMFLWVDFVSAQPANLSAAKIKTIYPQTVLPGTLFVVTGEGFGHIAGELKIGDVVVDNVLSWQDKVIWLRIPENIQDGSAVTVGGSTSEQTLTVAPEDAIKVSWSVDLAKVQAMVNQKYQEHGLETAPQFMLPLFIKGQWAKSGENFGNYDSGWEGGSKVLMYNEPGTTIWRSECVYTPDNLNTFGDDLMLFAFEDANDETRNLSPFESDVAFLLKVSWAKADSYATVDTDPAVKMAIENPNYNQTDKTLYIESPVGPDLSSATVAAVYPQTVLPGTLVAITGEGFGSFPVAVTIGDTVVEEAVSWDDSAIWLRIPAGIKDGDSVKLGNLVTEHTLTLAPEGSITVRWQVDSAQAQAIANRDYEAVYGLDAAPQFQFPLYLKGQWVKSGDGFGNYESGWDGGSKVLMYDKPDSNLWISECVFTTENLATYGENILLFAFEDANTETRNLSPFESDAAFTIKSGWAKADAYPEVDTDPAVKLAKDMPVITVESPIQVDLTQTQVQSLYPQVVLPGTLLAITGEGFGTIPASVKLGDVVVKDILDWQDHILWLRIPENIQDGSTVTVGGSTSEQTLTLAPEDSIKAVWQVDLAQAQAVASEQYEQHGLDQTPQFQPPLYLKGQWVKSGDNFGDFESGWDGGSKVEMYKEPDSEVRISECVFTPQDMETFGNSTMLFAFEDANSEVRNLSPFESDAAFILKVSWAKADEYPEVDTDPAVLIAKENPDYNPAEDILEIESPFEIAGTEVQQVVHVAEVPKQTQEVDVDAEMARLVAPSDFLPEWNTLKGLVSYQQEGNMLTLNLEDEKAIKVSFLTPSIFRVRFNKNGDYEQDNSYAIIKSDFGDVEYTVEDTDDALVVSTSELKIEIQKSPVRFSVFKGDRLIHADTKRGISWWRDRIAVHKELLEGTKFYGFGEKSGSFMKNGASMKMWNTDFYGYGKEDDPIYLSIPFFLEINQDYASGVFFDNTYQSYFNMGASNSEEYYFGALNGEMNYYFIAGDDSKEVIQQYTELTGRINMPPKWALGYQQCRWSYYPASRVEEIARNFRERKLPCDTIYLDIDYMDDYKSFTISEKNFPDMANFLKNLKADGFKFISIIDPGIKAQKGYHVYDSGIEGDYFIKMPNGSLAKGTVWPGMCVFPDFTRPEVREWWGPLYQALIDSGIDGFWNDMNEPGIFNTPHHTMWLDAQHYDFGQISPHTKIHNVYGQQMIRATLNGLNKLRPNNRNFVLSRSGYAGLQRYGAVWTGDNVANWEHLKLNISMVLNLGLSGMPLTGADIGGFSGAPTPELFARWMQLGALIPLYRGHTEKGTPDQEPWAFGDEVEEISHTYLELRYTMIHHLYDLAYEASQTGVPIVRPLFMEFPQDQTTYPIEDAYMVGDDLLVAPVVEEGAVSRTVYLPQGAQWFDYWTGKAYEGGQSYDVDAPLDVMPLFVKAGSVIPTQEVVQYVGEKEVNPITFLVYPGADDEYTLYLDDENSKAYQEGQYREVKLIHQSQEKQQTITFDVLVDGFTPTATGDYVYLNLLNASKPVSVKIAGQSVSLTAQCDALPASTENVSCFDAEQQMIQVKLFGIEDETAVEIQY